MYYVHVKNQQHLQQLKTQVKKDSKSIVVKKENKVTIKILYVELDYLASW